MSHVSYSTAVGSLMHAMICTRPNFSYAVSSVIHFMHNPTKNYRDVVK